MFASRARRVGGRLALMAAAAGVLVSSSFFLPGPSSDQAQAASTKGASTKAASTKKGASWKTERIEKFSGSSLPDGCGPYSGKYVGGSSAWSSKDVDVSGGLLKLRLEKKKSAGQPYRSGGVGCWGWAQKYGRYEVRAKVPRGKGIDSYLTLWPKKAGDGAWTGVELLAPGPETAYVTNGYGTKSESARVTGQYSGRFHDYVIEWAPKHIRFTVDGKEIYYSTRSYKGSRWFGMVVSNGDALTGVPDASTTLPVQFQIDRVKVSSYTGIPPKARPATQTPSQSRAAGGPTVVSTIQPDAADKLPAATTSASDVQPTSASPALAGGVWPWLLGGSLIAACAVATLNYPRNRRARKSAKAQARPRPPRTPARRM
jgi:beta-glucanase (GH16 family)